MIVEGLLLVESYFSKRPGQSGIRAARSRFEAWLAEATRANWKHPMDVKRQYGSVSVIAGNRLVFNISGNRYRLVFAVNYLFGVIDIRFFGTHAEYDHTDVETI